MLTKNQVHQLQTALVHQKAGRLADAAKLYNRILRETPDNFDCAYLLAVLYMQQENLNSAIRMFRRAARIRPDFPDVLYNLAVALGMAGNHEEAVPHYERVLKINPQHTNAHNNYAASLLQLNRHEDALHQYDRLIALHPDHADAYNNRGMALQNLKRFDAALGDYDRAIALRPDFPEAYVNRGNVLATLHRPDDALASYNKAIALRPNFADAYNNAGNIHCNRGSYREALEAYDRALSLQADDPEARSMRLYAKMHLCDWSDFDAERAELISCIRKGGSTYPFVSLAASSSLDVQRRCARQFSKARYASADAPIWRGEIYAHDRIRIAYLSADFGEHATAYLAAGLFEQHDQSRFEVTGLSFGPDRNSPMRQRIQGPFEHFIDVAPKSDEETADLVRRLEIDIAVDLMGYTQNARTGIFARRPAPIQVSYLGYLGTMGADFIDYVIADKITVPADHMDRYDESVVHLPDCFLATDDRLAIAPHTPSRTDMGLPSEGFVFCSFNNSYKFGRTTFELWMRLLRAVEGSVLWLLEANAEMAGNLRREAQRCGVDPGRIVFAPRIALAQHLARQRLADLFLDTIPYNAGATGAVALWAGVPLLTVVGDTFVGRMAASMLHAVGLPELAAASLAAYEALALKLARDPSLVAALKTRLARNRNACPLFDTARFTRHIEAAYAAMWQAYRNGRPAASFAVEPAG